MTLATPPITPPPITPPPISPPPAPQTDALRMRGLFAAIVCITVAGMALTLAQPLLGVLLDRAGESGFRIGVNAAAASLPVFLAAPLAPGLMRRLGVAPFLVACLALSAVMLLGFKLWTDYWWWLALRFGMAVGFTGLFLASEFWIVTAAPPAARGRVVAIYALALSGSFALGPAVLRLTGVEGWTPFLVAAGVCVLAAAPLLATTGAQPPIDEKPAAGVLRYFITDPSLMFAVALFGALEFTMAALGAVWGVRLGMSAEAAVTLVSALAAGGLVCQLPLGWAADRYPARPLLLMAALVSLASTAVLPLVAGTPTLLYLVLVLWGGVAAGLYTVSLTAAGARYRGAELAGANAAIVTAYGIGSLLGPPLTGAAMDAFGSHGLSLTLGASAALYAALVLLRLRSA